MTNLIQVNAKQELAKFLQERTELRSKLLKIETYHEKESKELICPSHEDYETDEEYQQAMSDYKYELCNQPMK